MTKTASRHAYKPCQYEDFRVGEAAASAQRAQVEGRDSKDSLQRAMNKKNPPPTMGKGTPAFVEQSNVGVEYMSVLQRSMLSVSTERVVSVRDAVRTYERQLNAVSSLEVP